MLSTRPETSAAAHHLQALAGIILVPADGARQHRAVAQCLGKNIGALGVGRKAAEQNVLAVVDDNAETFLAVIFLQLRKALYNGPWKSGENVRR